MDPTSAFRAKQFAKMVIADLAFKQVVALSEHMMQCHFTARDPLFPPQMCGIAVTYSKNFVSGNDFGPLPERFRKFEDSTLADTHKRLIESRHKIYAHRDTEAVKTMEFDDLSDLVPYQLTVEWSPEFTAYPVTPELSPEILPFVAELAKYQSNRVYAHLQKIGDGMLIKGKKYYPGRRYTLGVDFP